MKILGSIFILFLALFAGELHVYMKKNPISLGGSATLVIEASGDDIQIPTIGKIAGYPVVGRSESESVVANNANIHFKKVVQLSFYPDRNTTIPPISVRIDGKEYKSKPIKLIVKRHVAKDKSVEFLLTLNKKEAYVGEPLILEMILKIKKELHIVNYDFVAPKFDGFWVKRLKEEKNLQQEGDYLVKRVRFLLIPQKPGYLTIAPAIFKYAVAQERMDMFGFSITTPVWKSVISNNLHIIAKPLPQDVDIVGDFRIKERVDKNVTKPNEPVNLTITIDGYGNLENFSGIDLNISKATVYEDNPNIKVNVENGKLHAHFEQHFSIIAAQDFTIKALLIPYFSLKEKRINYLKTQPIHIKVLGGSKVGANVAQQKPLHINSSKPSVVPKRSFALFWIGFASGIGVSMVLFGLWFFYRKKDSFHLSFGSKRELLMKLMPYIAESEEARKMADALYAEIVQGKRSGIGKKEVERVLKDLMQRRGTLHP